MTRLITIFDKDLNQRVFRLFEENEVEEKVDTNLTISASSASIDVGNNVELTGVLTDENSVPLGGMSIRILKNNVLVDTVTTNSSGVYSKIITGLDIGTYHFHASYAGNDVYDNALSETIDVSVVGHTYAVTITADKQSILTTESVTVTGTVTRDGTGYSGQTVRLFDDGTLIDTLTTDSNGEYTKTVSNLTQGAHRFYSQFDVYESSTILVEVVEHNYSINITADNPIIQSGDTSIITATLLDGSDPMVGETLSYSLTNKGTVVGSGSASTNNDGEISITYVGAGLGDIDVEVTYSTLLQKTYELEDCMKYYPLVDNSDESAFTIPTGTTVSYSDEGMRLSANAYKQIKLTEKLTSDCSVEFTVVDYSTSSYSYPPVIVYAYTNGETTPNQQIFISNDSSSMLILGNTINHVPVKGGKYKIEYTSSNIRVYENNTLLASASNSVGLPTRFEWHTGPNRWAVYKDLKIKALPEKEPDNLTLSSATPIIQKDDTATINATLTHNDVAVSGKTLNYSITHDNNGVLNILDSGSVVTDTNGEASITYTGTGIGDVTFEVTYDTLLQETYELIDAIYYDTATSDQSSNYYYTPIGGVSFSYQNNWYVLTLGTSANYVQLNGLTDNVKGKTINFEVELELNGASTRLEVYADSTRIGYSPYSTSNGVLSISDLAIPSDATNVYFRIVRRYTDDGDSIKFKNFKLYQI